MLFPQFVVYQNKSKLNYIDINNLLILTIHLKQTWYWESFKRDTHNTWMTFKDKLNSDQKVVFRNAIKKLRELFINKQINLNTGWLSSSVVHSILFNISPSILQYSKRQQILKSDLNS